MPKTKDLRNCTGEEIRKFLDSFDIVLSDCDGVLWHVDSPIKNAVEALSKLQSFGKKVYLVTNNATTDVSKICTRLRNSGFQAEDEQVIIPPKVIAWYLKRTNFKGQAFAIAMQPFRKSMIDAGIDLLDQNTPHLYPDDVTATVGAVQDQKSVKAVIIDFDINCNWGKLALAISCLKRKEVLYFVGPLDEWVACGNGTMILGPGPLTNIVTKASGRTPISYAKPSTILQNYILDLCEVTKPRRCLFIGDTVNQDMKFGAMCGFQKLFVGTGCDNIMDAEKTEETRPEYYLSDFGQLIHILNGEF